jgi:NhaP-type Na+/H+ or K+/H+ antiporter
VVATVTAVAGTVAVLVPGIGISAAIALGAMVAPPDPVAVEAVAGPVRMPRRLLAVLQSEGLFNDATALVVFQTAVLATGAGRRGVGAHARAPLRAGRGGAVAIGMGVARVARWITARVADTTGRSALTLVLPFAVYVAADEIGASGVVAVVVLALQLRSASGADEAAERLVQRSFWDVVELLITGVAFGLMGLDLRQVVEAVGTDLPRMLRDAVVVCAVVVAVRLLWMLVAWWLASRSNDPERAPRTGRETVVLSWCGMRGLATLALALSLPTATAAGEAFPQRAEIVLIAVVVLVVTLVLPGSRCRSWSGGSASPRTPTPSTLRSRRSCTGPRPRRRPCSRPTSGSAGCPRASAPACGSGWTASTASCAAIRHRPRTASVPRPCAATARSCPPCRPKPSPPPAPRCWPPAASPASIPKPPTASCAGSICAPCCSTEGVSRLMTCRTGTPVP